MELSTSFLQNLAETNPGNFAIYMVKNGALADVYHSSSLAALSGLSQKEYLELTSLNAQEVVALNDRERVKAALTQLLVDKKDIDLTYRIFHKSQGFVWVHAKCRYLGELEGAPVVYSIFEDTSGEADVHAQLLSDTSSIIYVVDSLTYEVLYANQQALRFWGKEDYTNAKCFNFIRKEKGVCQNCLLHQLVNGHYHENAVYYETLGKWVNIDAHAINWHGRDAVAFYANDVTEQQKRQASLEVDNRSLETTINNIPVGVGVCLFKDGKITTTILNKTLVSLWGMEGKPFSFSDPALFAKIHPEDRPLLAKMFCQIPTRTEPFEFVFRYQVDPSQPYRYLHTQCSFLVQGQERLIFLCFSDVTKSRLSELQLNQERKVYEFAVQETGIVAWQYDIPNHQVIISEQQRIKPFSLLQPTKGVLKNVPDCFETVIEPESLPALRELYRKVDSGEEKASAEIWFKASEKEGRTCERISYTIIASEGGKPLLAYGISQNITALKKDEERYLQAYKELEGARPNATAAFKLNLTQDCYFLAKDSPLGSYEKRGKVNDFIRRFGSVIDDEKLQKDFWTRYNRDSLLAFFPQWPDQVHLGIPDETEKRTVARGTSLALSFPEPHHRGNRGLGL